MIPESNYKQDDFVKQMERTEGITEEMIERTTWYINKYEYLKGKLIQEKEEEWQEVEDFYRGNNIDENTPKSVNVILPTIEGQVSSLIDKNLQANAKGKGYSDHQFASTVNPILHTIIKENKLKRILKRAGRRYIKQGNCIIRVSWDDDMLEGIGLPRYDAPLVNKVFVDDKITDMMYLQQAEYIIEEVGFKSIIWAKEEFGEDKANLIQMGNGTEGYEAKNTGDDSESFTLLYIWTKVAGNLQRLEVSRCGVPLRFSDENEPFYKHVNNNYPYFMASLYHMEGEFYGFGDGQILIPVQKLIDKLYREILTSVKYSAQRKTFVDPAAKMNPNEFNSDPSKPIYAKKPREYIYDQQGVGVNPVVFNLLQMLMQEVQKMTRFSTLMTGVGEEKGMTATQAGIQMQQGDAGMQDKKMDLGMIFGEALEYGVSLCMEYWSAAVALRVSDNQDDFEWVDARELSQIPVMIPRTNEFETEWDENQYNIDKEMPEFIQLEMGKDKVPATKKISLDIDISIGEGLPTSKIATYNLILSLAQLQIPDEFGQPKSLLNFKDVKKMIEEIVGIKISDEEEPMPQEGMPMGGMPMGNAPMVNSHDNIPNAGLGGIPMGGGAV